MLDAQQKVKVTFRATLTVRNPSGKTVERPIVAEKVITKEEAKKYGYHV